MRFIPKGLLKLSNAPKYQELSYAEGKCCINRYAEDAAGVDKISNDS